MKSDGELVKDLLDKNGYKVNSAIESLEVSDGWHTVGVLLKPNPDEENGTDFYVYSLNEENRTEGRLVGFTEGCPEDQEYYILEALKGAFAEEIVKVGSIEGDTINREYYRQGYVVKDEAAYRNGKEIPCYVPELSDTIYKPSDFLALCHDQKDFADELFEGVDWQHPESLMEDWLSSGEWVECKCGKLVNYGDGCNDTVCPFCGREVDAG